MTASGDAGATIENGDTTPSLLETTDFATVPEGGSTTSRTFVIRNDGAADLVLSGVQVPNGFEILSLDLVAPLAPGEQRELVIGVTATTPGTFSGNVVLQSNDGDDNPYSFAISVVVTPAEPAYTDVNISDFNGDGTNDLVFRWAANGGTNVGLISGNAMVGTAALRRLVDASWQVVGVADFDGDRDADLLFRNTTTGRNAIWQFDGTTFVAAKALPALALTWYVVGTGDFNHDGTADIVWRNNVDGRDAVWNIGGAAFDSSTLAPRLPQTVWEGAGVGDFDDDGDADILFRNRVTGANAVWLLEDNALTSSVLTSPLGLAWEVADVRDFNGDETQDIAWRNPTLGRTALWLMSGTTRSEAVAVSGFPNRNWLTPGQGQAVPRVGWLAARSAAVSGHAWSASTGDDAETVDSLLSLEPLVALPIVRA